jgi:hypothetical protein
MQVKNYVYWIAKTIFMSLLLKEKSSRLKSMMQSR